MDDNGSASCASQDSDYQFVLTASDSTPGSNLEGQGTLFIAEEVPTRHEPTKEQGFGPFGSTEEPVAPFDTSGWFNGSGGANGTDKIQNGAMDHEKEGGGEGDPKEGKLRSRQRRDE